MSLNRKDVNYILKTISIDLKTWGMAVELSKLQERSISGCIREAIKHLYKEKGTANQ